MAKPANPMTLREWTEWETAPDSRERPFVRILDAVRAKCLDCCDYNAAEIERCGITKCPLHPYRLRSNPFHTRDMTDEQREALRQRAKRVFAPDPQP